MSKCAYLQVLVILWTFLIISFSASSQATNANELKKLADKAQNHLKLEEYAEAYTLYSQLIELDSNIAMHHYGKALAIFEGSFSKTQALPYFENAYIKGIKQEKPEIFYYLGRVYQLNQNFTAALASYNTFTPYIQNTRAGKTLRNEIDVYIDQCEKGISQVKSGRDKPLKWADNRVENVTKYYVDEKNYIKITNLGKEVNTKYSEYGAMFLNEMKSMLFTSRKEGSTGQEKYFDGQYYEDIYVAELINGRWTNIKNLNASPIINNAITNSKKHDATVSVSPDGKTMFFYHDNQIQFIEFKNGLWSNEFSLSEWLPKIGSLVTGATLSPSGNKLYLVAERSDSYGARDIYVSEKNADGSWSEVQNLGKNINSKKEEASPFLPNDTTLFFSSQGHSSIGGYDVYVSYFKNGTWQQAQNLEIPINSSADEINYFVSEDGRIAYYASNREGGYGEYDIYMVSKGEDKEIDSLLLAQLEKQNTEKMQSRLLRDDEEFEISEELAAKTSNEKIKTKAEYTTDSSIIVNNEIIAENLMENMSKFNDSEPTEDETSQESISNDLKDNSLDLAMQMQEKLNELAEVKEPEKVEDETSAEQTRSALISKTSEPKTEAGKRVLVLNTLQFDFNSNELSESNQVQLDEIARLLINDENLYAEVVGHTDNTGSAEINKNISRQRALKGYNYLLKKGVDPNRVLYAFAGMNEPLFPNDSPENRNKNRRIEASAFAPIIKEDITFNFDKTFLNRAAVASLNIIIEEIKSKNHKEIYLVGHTDSDGPAAYNLILSELRAKAVEEYLLNKIPELKIKIMAVGDEKPLVPNDTKENKMLNRRVELIVIE